MRIVSSGQTPVDNVMPDANAGAPSIPVEAAPSDSSGSGTPADPAATAVPEVAGASGGDFTATRVAGPTEDDLPVDVPVDVPVAPEVGPAPVDDLVVVGVLEAVTAPEDPHVVAAHEVAPAAPEPGPAGEAHSRSTGSAGVPPAPVAEPANEGPGEPAAPVSVPARSSIPGSGTGAPAPAAVATVATGPRQASGPGGGKRRRRGEALEPSTTAMPARRPAPFLGGPAVWAVGAIIAILLAGTVLTNGAFTPFAVDTVPVATNTLASDVVVTGPGRVQTTAITLGDLVPGMTVVRATFAVAAEAPGTGKPLVGYVTLISDAPAPHVRAALLRCLDAAGAPTPCDAAVAFADARVDVSGAVGAVVETTGGPPVGPTVRPMANGDLEVLDGAGNVRKGASLRGVPPVARPAKGSAGTITDFFLGGGPRAGLSHGAQDIGVNGATATLPLVKGVAGLAAGDRAHLVAYFYAVAGTAAPGASAPVPLTIAVVAVGAD